MNLNPWKNDQIEPHGNGEYMILASNIKDLSPHFLPIMDGKMDQYPPKMGKIPPKRGKNGGIRNFLSIFIYKFWTFFCHLPIPPKWGDS